MFDSKSSRFVSNSVFFFQIAVFFQIRIFYVNMQVETLKTEQHGGWLTALRRPGRSNFSIGHNPIGTTFGKIDICDSEQCGILGMYSQDA